MTLYKEFSIGSNNKSPLGSFGPLIGLIITLVVLYFVVKGLFWGLTILAPFLLIGAAILDYTVLTDFIKFLLKLLKENPLMGLIAILLTVIGFPAVTGFLFLKAWARKSINNKIKDIKQERARYDTYEEVKDDASTPTKSTEVSDDEFLQLPTIEKSKLESKENKKDNDYENLFK